MLIVDSKEKFENLMKLKIKLATVGSESGWNGWSMRMLENWVKVELIWNDDGRLIKWILMSIKLRLDLPSQQKKKKTNLF